MLSLDIFDETFIEILELNKFSLIEDQKRKNKFIMKLDIDFSDCLQVYRLSEMHDEHSKIKFLCYTEYPDGVFIKQMGKGIYKVIIVELKKNATNHLDKIPKQLHSGLLHAISLIELSHTVIDGIDNITSEDIDITYDFYVGSASPEIRELHKKTVPGTLSPKQKRYTYYLNNEVYHCIKKDKILNFIIKKIQFEKIENQYGYEEYYSSVTM